MRPLRYSINVTLDGCVDHMAGPVDVPELSEDLHREHAKYLATADALLFGRVTYQLMEEGWRWPPAGGGWSDEQKSFAETIGAAKKYVVSSSLDQVDWNSELVRGDLESAVRQLKEQPGDGILTGGVKLPVALTEMRLIDEYHFVVMPRVAGRGPRLLDGLSRFVDLKLVNRVDWTSGAVALTYEPVG